MKKKTEWEIKDLIDRQILLAIMKFDCSVCKHQTLARHIPAKRFINREEMYCYSCGNTFVRSTPCWVVKSSACLATTLKSGGAGGTARNGACQ